MTNEKDTRISFPADPIIFNWEMVHDELRVDGVEQYRVQADYSAIKNPLGIQAHTGGVWIKSITAFKS